MAGLSRALFLAFALSLSLALVCAPVVFAALLSAFVLFRRHS
jgi:hypothetical protein